MEPGIPATPPPPPPLSANHSFHTLVNIIVTEFHSLAEWREKIGWRLQFVTLPARLSASPCPCPSPVFAAQFSNESTRLAGRATLFGWHSAFVVFKIFPTLTFKLICILPHKIRQAAVGKAAAYDDYDNDGKEMNPELHDCHSSHL